MAKNMLGNKGFKRNRFDDALSARIKVSPRNNSLGDPLSTGVKMAQQDLNNEVNIRNEHDDDAELFTNLSKIAGDRPEGAAALFAGIAEGAAYGAKTKSTAKKQEAVDKYDRVTNYFRQVNDQAAEMKEWYQKREFAQQKYMPQVLAYAENIDKLDTQSQRLMAQSILEGWNRSTGDDYKLDTIDGSDPFVMTVSSKEGTQVIDVRDLFAGDEVLQQRLAMKTPEYQMKLQEDRQQKAFDNQIKERTVTAMEGRAGKKEPDQGFQGQGVEDNSININGKDYLAIPLNDAKAATAYRKDVTKASSQIPVNNQAIETIEKMEEIFNRKPEIGNSFLNALDAGDENSWSNLIAKKFTNSEDLADIQKLKKLSSDLNLSTVLGVPGKGATDLLKQTIKSAAPHGKLTPQAFGSIAKQWKKVAQDKNDLIIAQMINLPKGLQISAKPVMTNQPEGSNNFQNANKELAGSIVTVVDPDTGQTQQIDESYLDAAIAGGWEQAQNG